MSVSFEKANGSAIKGADAYKITEGVNIVRLVGNVLPRYVYWFGKTPIECLAFDRDLEKFDNSISDPVRERFPDRKCSWNYAINCVVNMGTKENPDYKVKVFNLKKKLYEQIKLAAEDLGNPTDTAKGWDIVFKKEVTGSGRFDVAYSLMPLRCKPRALTPEELTVIEESSNIDEVCPRPSKQAVEKQIEDILNKESGEKEEEDNPTDSDKESTSKFTVEDDDISF